MNWGLGYPQYGQQQDWQKGYGKGNRQQPYFSGKSYGKSWGKGAPAASQNSGGISSIARNFNNTMNDMVALGDMCKM
eukprot:7834029-Karenia_brevis.AAC.1